MSSSPSRPSSQNPSKENESNPEAVTDLVIIADGGDDWSGALFSYFARRNGLSPVLVEVEPRRQIPLSAIHVGNGEMSKNARLIFGESLYRQIWPFSEANFECSRNLLRSLSCSSDPQSLDWFNGQKVILEEPVLVIGNAALNAALVSSSGTSPTQSKTVAIERGRSMESLVTLTLGTAKRQWRASTIIVVSESLPPQLFASLRDKIIPVTLSAFGYTSKATLPPFNYALFNSGVDFAMKGEKLVWLGSYRNLFEDKAVGILSVADPKTGDGVRKFFGSLGWIEPGENPRTALAVEAITCDGLPLVGSLPENPGVYIVSGFAGRRQNFIFEVASLLTAGLAGKGSYEKLSPFSTRRFL